MTVTLLRMALLLGSVVATVATGQVDEKTKFTIHVVRIQRVRAGCSAEVFNGATQYILMSNSPGACFVLRSGESYKAARVTIGKPPDDVPALEIFYKPEQPDTKLVLFVESEESH